jgi:transposase
MFYIDIDIAKKNHEASIIDSSEKSLSKSISFLNSAKWIEEFNNFIAEFSVTTNNCTIGMEATGHY